MMVPLSPQWSSPPDAEYDRKQADAMIEHPAKAASGGLEHCGDSDMRIFHQFLTMVAIFGGSS